MKKVIAIVAAVLFVFLALTPYIRQVSIIDVDIRALPFFGGR